MHFHIIPLIGVLRLRGCFAKRSSLFAQDDRSTKRWLTGDSRSGIPWARCLRDGACCNPKSNLHAHHPAGTTSPWDTDTFPWCGRARAARYWPQRRRNPCLFRNRWPRRSNPAPSPWAKPGASQDRSRAALHHPTRRRPAGRRIRSAEDARRRSGYRRPPAACKARSDWSSHTRTIRCRGGGFLSSAESRGNADRRGPAAPKSGGHSRSVARD